MGKKNFTFLRKELSRFGINLCLYTHVEKFNRIDVKVFRRTEKHMYFCRFVDPLENRWQNFQKLRKCSNTKPKAREAVKILFSFFFFIAPTLLHFFAKLYYRYNSRYPTKSRKLQNSRTTQQQTNGGRNKNNGREKRQSGRNMSK